MSVAGSVLLASIPILISLYAKRYRKADFGNFIYDNDLNLPEEETFDFIIVGGGTAGCLLANRLSKNFTVLLLEVGGIPPPLQSVPNLAQFTESLPGINFLYNSTKQKNAALNTRGKILISTGKMLGGSSSHNGMKYDRGNPKDYDRWANLTGDKSWRYKNLVPFFKKTEGYVGKQNLSAVTLGRNGDLSIDDEPSSSATELWEAAGRELGYSLQDANSMQTEGVTRTLFTKRRGRRESSYTAFIKPIEGIRKTLTIYCYSAVSEIIFEKKRAVGVYYKRHGVPKVAFAKKEIILSAGAYVSPLILIKSGVGPTDELKKIQKSAISTLPVGYNLMDHPGIPLAISIGNVELAWDVGTNLSFSDVLSYKAIGRGPLALTRTGNSGAFLESKIRNKTDPDWPDIQLDFNSNKNMTDTVMIFVSLTAEKSRGRVTLNAATTSIEANNSPIINLNFFDENDDFEAAIDGIELALSFLETKAFKSIGARFSAPETNACSRLEFLSREYWKCYISQTASSLWHAAGTCKMGLSTGDPSAVVDSKLRVIGTSGLRVVDASVMPFITNSYTAAPTMVIAEKLAAQILDDYETEIKKTIELTEE